MRQILCFIILLNAGCHLWAASDYSPEAPPTDSLTSLSLDELLSVSVGEDYKGAGIFQSPTNKATPNSVNFGLLVPLRDLPRYSTSLIAAADLAAEKINASGGINGKKLVIIRADIGYSRDAAVTFSKQLIERYNVKALFGPGTSDAVRAVMKNVSIPHNVPLVTASASSDSLAQLPHKGLFWRMSPSNDSHAQSIVEFLKSKQRASRIALISGKDLYGQEVATKIRQQLPNSEFHEVEYSSLINIKKLPLSSDFKRLQAFKPDAVVITLHGNIINGYLEQFERHWEGKIPLMVSGDTLTKATNKDIKKISRVAKCMHIVFNDTQIKTPLKRQLKKKLKFNSLGYDPAYIYDAIILMSMAKEYETTQNQLLPQLMSSLTDGTREFDGLNVKTSRRNLNGVYPVRFLGASGLVKFDELGNNLFSTVKIEQYWESDNSQAPCLNSSRNQCSKVSD